MNPPWYANDLLPEMSMSNYLANVVFIALYLAVVAMLNLASFNVRGLSKSVKQECLGTDCINYNVDIIAIQETKVSEFSDLDLSSGVRLIILGNIAKN